MSGPVPPPVGVHHPAWAGSSWYDKSYGDGVREVVHDLHLARVGRHDAVLMSYQYVDAAGNVTVHDEVVHLAGEGPMSAAEAEQLAAALVRGARLLAEDQAARRGAGGDDRTWSASGAG
jgi:hypothetical protein